jgi:hypothetical protein
MDYEEEIKRLGVELLRERTARQKIEKERAEERAAAKKRREDDGLAAALRRAGAAENSLPYAIGILREGDLSFSDDDGRLLLADSADYVGGDVNALARSLLTKWPSLTQKHSDAVREARARESGDPSSFATMSAVDLLEAGITRPPARTPSDPARTASNPSAATAARSFDEMSPAQLAELGLKQGGV